MRSCMPTLTLDLWDISVVLVVMNKFDLQDALAKYVTPICMLVLTFVNFVSDLVWMHVYPHQSTCVEVDWTCGL
jgi:hypothetical protein